VKALLALSLLVPAVAFGQPYLSPATTGQVLERSPFVTRAAPAMSLARDGNGFVAAWSAGAVSSRIYAVRLDASFAPASPILEFPPLLGAAFDASYPDIAVVDSGYALVWLERERIAQPRAATVVLSRLSRSFVPSPPARVTAVADSGFARIAGSDANSLSINVSGSIYAIDGNGVTRLAQVSTVPGTVEDALTNGAQLASTSTEYFPVPSGYCIMACAYRHESWKLTVDVGPWVFSSSFGSEISQSTIGFGGGTYLLTWFGSDHFATGNVNAVRIDANGFNVDALERPLTLGDAAPDSAQTRPSIAWDGERFLIVWQAAHDIVGATLAPDGRRGDVTLVATPADERNPLVVPVAPGRFVLAYEINVDEQHRRLAMRYVDFHQPQGRHRAAR